MQSCVSVALFIGCCLLLLSVMAEAGLAKVRPNARVSNRVSAVKPSVNMQAVEEYADDDAATQEATQAAAVAPSLLEAQAQTVVDTAELLNADRVKLTRRLRQQERRLRRSLQRHVRRHHVHVNELDALNDEESESDEGIFDSVAGAVEAAANSPVTKQLTDAAVASAKVAAKDAIQQQLVANLGTGAAAAINESMGPMLDAGLQGLSDVAKSAVVAGWAELKGLMKDKTTPADFTPAPADAALVGFAGCAEPNKASIATDIAEADKMIAKTAASLVSYASSKGADDATTNAPIISALTAVYASVTTAASITNIVKAALVGGTLESLAKHIADLKPLHHCKADATAPCDVPANLAQAATCAPGASVTVCPSYITTTAQVDRALALVRVWLTKLLCKISVVDDAEFAAKNPTIPAKDVLTVDRIVECVKTISSIPAAAPAPGTSGTAY